MIGGHIYFKHNRKLAHGCFHLLNHVSCLSGAENHDFRQLMFSYARFTLADPTPRLASDVVGGKSGQNLPTSRRDPFTLAEWRTMRTFVAVGTVNVR